MAESITDYLNSDSPLSDNAIEFLLNYKEEDSHVDYKETFDTDSEKEWIELTKDIMAYANTEGGYLVFGVRDSSYDLIGIDNTAASTLKQTDLLQQKINRFIEPNIYTLRSKEYNKNGNVFVILFIPVTTGKTHIVSKDANFVYPSGKKKVIIHQGTLYVRRSAGNHLCDSRDLDEIISRRINQFKKNLLSNISRVVEAPQEADVYILSQDPTSETSTKFIIQDTPDAIKVKGMSFTVSPETVEQEISGWIALSKKDPAAIPPQKILWKWYRERKKIKLPQENKLAVAKFCLVSDVPVFFWIQECSADSILSNLESAIELISSKTRVDIIVGVAAFLGKTQFKKIQKKINSKNPRRLSKQFTAFPPAGPKSLFSQELLDWYRPTKTDEKDNSFEEQMLKQLENIVESVFENNYEQPGVMKRREAHAIDCCLYAQENKYKNTSAAPDAQKDARPNAELSLRSLPLIYSDAC